MAKTGKKGQKVTKLPKKCEKWTKVPPGPYFSYKSIRFRSFLSFLGKNRIFTEKIDIFLKNYQFLVKLPLFPNKHQKHNLGKKNCLRMIILLEEVSVIIFFECANHYWDPGSHSLRFFNARITGPLRRILANA